MPIGKTSTISSKIILATEMDFPICENRVRHSNRPDSARIRMKLDGTPKNPIIFDARKYIEAA